MTQDVKKNKLDLLGFQRTLNEQFLEIFEAKKSGKLKKEEMGFSSDLGLGDRAIDLNFFVPLKDLKNISMDNNFETIELTKSWIAGFNQTRGEVYTIMDFSRVMEMATQNLFEEQRRKINSDTRIIYIKELHESKMGFILNTLELKYTAEYTKIFEFKETDNGNFWSLGEEVEFETFVKQEKTTEKEWLILNEVNQYVKENKKWTSQEITDRLKDVKGTLSIVPLLIKDVYLDEFGQHPIFVLNIENLTNFLINVSPF
jgi:chemotaxis signal transduction protein